MAPLLMVPPRESSTTNLALGPAVLKFTSVNDLILKLAILPGHVTVDGIPPGEFAKWKKKQDQKGGAGGEFRGFPAAYYYSGLQKRLRVTASSLDTTNLLYPLAERVRAHATAHYRGFCLGPYVHPSFTQRTGTGLIVSGRPGVALRPPCQRGDSEHPTFVIEAGWSFFRPALYDKMCWWFDVSRGAVESVLIVSAEYLKKRIIIDHYKFLREPLSDVKHGPDREPVLMHRVCVTLASGVVGKSWKKDCPDSYAVSYAHKRPLQIRFYDIFRKKGNFPDVPLGEAFFQQYAADFWSGKSCSYKPNLKL